MLDRPNPVASAPARDAASERVAELLWLAFAPHGPALATPPQG